MPGSKHNKHGRGTTDLILPSDKSSFQLSHADVASSQEVLLLEGDAFVPEPASSQSLVDPLAFHDAISSSQETIDPQYSSSSSDAGALEASTPPSFQPPVSLLSPESSESIDSEQEREAKKAAFEKVLQTFIAHIDSLFNLADHSLTKRQEIYAQIAKFCEAHLSLFSPSFAIAHILTKLATGYLETGELEAAKKTFLFALSLYRKLGDTDSYELARTWHNLGGVNYRLGKFAKAVLAFDIAIDICQRLGDPRLSHLSLRARALVWHHQGEFKAAENAYQTCLALQQKYLDQKLAALDYIDILTKLGHLFNAQGMLQTANAYFEKALSIDPNSINHAQALVSQSRLAHIPPKKALKLLEAATSIKQKLSDADPVDILTGLAYARVCLALGSVSDAEEFLKEVRALHDVAKNVDKPLLAEMLMLEGELSRIKGDVNDSVNKLGAALDVCKKYYGELRPILLGQIHLFLAKTYQVGNNAEMSFNHANNALTIFEEYSFDNNHPWKIEALNMFYAGASLNDSLPLSSSSSGEHQQANQGASFSHKDASCVLFPSPSAKPPKKSAAIPTSVSPTTLHRPDAKRDRYHEDSYKVSSSMKKPRN